MRALFAVLPSLNHPKAPPDTTALLLIIADEVGKRSPLAETGSAGLLAIVGLRLNLLDLVGHGVEEMGEKGGDEEADRASTSYIPLPPPMTHVVLSSD